MKNKFINNLRILQTFKRGFTRLYDNHDLFEDIYGIKIKISVTVRNI